MLNSLRPRTVRKMKIEQRVYFKKWDYITVDEKGCLYVQNNFGNT